MSDYENLKLIYNIKFKHNKIIILNKFVDQYLVLTPLAFIMACMHFLIDLIKITTKSWESHSIPFSAQTIKQGMWFPSEGLVP